LEEQKEYVERKKEFKYLLSELNFLEAQTYFSTDRSKALELIRKAIGDLEEN